MVDIDNKKLEKVVNNLYLFYRVIVASNFTENLPAPHIKKLSDELMKMYRGDYHRLCVAMPPRHKLVHSTPVLTIDGWKTHGELEVGDYVYGLNGKPTKIIGTSDESLCDRLVTFSNGSQILAHSDHLWTIQKDNELITIPTSKLKQNDYLPKVNYDELEKQTNLKLPNQKIFVKNIEKVEGGMGKCIEITNEDGIYLVGKELIPTHNSKSSLITISYPMWLIFHNPNLNILIVNNSSSLSEKFGIELREYIREYGKYFNVYLSDVKRSQSYLMFCDSDGKLYKGSIRLVGAGGSITGTDADYLIIDDPYKGLKEEFTETAIEKKIDWFNNIIEQRIEPHTRLIILHTRWVQNDIQGWIKKNDAEEYNFIEFPAIKKDNTPLWHQRYSIEDLEKKRNRMGYRMFNAIYQQQPLDETSEFFDLTNLKNGRPTGANIIAQVRAWDIASSDDSMGDKNDYTVGALMQLYDNNDVVISNIIRGQFGANTKNIIQQTAITDGLDIHIVVETGVAGAGKLLFEEWKEQLRGFIVERAVAVTSKEDRATPFRNAILDGHIYLDLSDKETKTKFIQEMGGFPLILHDDQIDAVAHGFNYLCRCDMGVTPDLLYIDF